MPWLGETLIRLDPYCDEKSAQHMIDSLEDDCLVMGLNCGIDLVNCLGNEATFDKLIGAFLFNDKILFHKVQPFIPRC